jgi:hypothetical protein
MAVGPVFCCAYPGPLASPFQGHSSAFAVSMI